MHPIPVHTTTRRLAFKLNAVVMAVLLDNLGRERHLPVQRYPSLGTNPHVLRRPLVQRHRLCAAHRHPSSHRISSLTRLSEQPVASGCAIIQATGTAAPDNGRQDTPIGWCPCPSGSRRWLARPENPDHVRLTASSASVIQAEVRAITHLVQISSRPGRGFGRSVGYAG